MAEHGQGPQSGTRDNGLRAGRYVAIGDLDPRVADAALHALRDEGIAAYVVPTPGARGGYLELRLPAKPTDRLFVDEQRAETACDVLARETDAPVDAVAAPTRDGDGATDPAGRADAADDDLDVEAAWEQILLSLRSADTGEHPWPSSEDVAAADPVERHSAPTREPGPTASTRPAPEDPDEHYVPPTPPPLPRLALPTVLCLVSIVAGVVVNVTGIDGGDLFWLGVLAIIGGAAGLVWRTKDGPPTDSGWDDGAVV